MGIQCSTDRDEQKLMNTRKRILNHEGKMRELTVSTDSSDDQRHHYIDKKICLQ